MRILVTVFLILLMVLVHEWGHFIAARICKLPVYEFAIGMGPLIYQHKSKKTETKWSIRLLPIGGYCAFDNAEELGDNANGLMDLALDKLPTKQRIFITAAGPLMNILSAFVIIFFTLSFGGNMELTTSVSGLEEGRPAYNYLQEGDTIIRVNGVDLNGDQELMSTLIGESEEFAEVTVLRDNEELTYNIETFYNPDQQSYNIGFYKGYKYSPMALSKALPASFNVVINDALSVYEGLYSVFISRQYNISDMSSIVSIVKVMSDYATLEKIIEFLMLAALIDVNLGVMNLLPIPALDGSKICQAIIEKCIKRPLNQKFVVKLTAISFGCLMIFGFFVMYLDITKMLK